MNSARIFGTAAILGLLAFGVLFLLSVLAWRVFPYPSGGDQLVQTHVWLYHILAEKVVGLILGCAVAFLAARAYRPSWKVGVVTGVLAAVTFQFVSIVVYLIRFGSSAYARYNALLSTLLTTIALGALFAFLAVWRDYRAHSQMRSNETVE